MRKVNLFPFHIIVSLLLVAVSASFSTAQRRGTSSPSSSAQTEANKFWNGYAPLCGGSRYIKKAAGIFVELRGFQIHTILELVSEADRLNGIEAKGSSRYTASSSRTYSGRAWRAWQSGLPQDASLTSSVRFQKTRTGSWRFSGTGYFNDYARKMTCADVPGLPQTARRSSLSRDEVPTNSIQIDDTHVFPIEHFYLWEESGKGEGTRFPQSSATYVYWKILYRETAFAYRPPQTESYWYKDGKQWSYAESAGFSNTGAGQLSNGKGWKEPGHWEVGSYTIKIYVRKQLVKIARFDIVPDRELNRQIRYDGIYRFNDTAETAAAEGGSVYLLRLYNNGSYLFAKTSAANAGGLEASEVGECLLWQLPHKNCGEFEKAYGYYQVSGSRIKFTVRLSDIDTVYTGTIGEDALELESSGGSVSLNESSERFVFWGVRVQ